MVAGREGNLRRRLGVADVVEDLLRRVDRAGVAHRQHRFDEGLAVDLIDAPARLRLGSVAALAERILAVGNADEERRDLLHAGGEVALLVRLRDGAVEVRGGHRDDRGRRDERSEHASMVRGHPRAGKEDPPRLALGRLAAWGKVRKLLLAVRDAAARQVVWGQLELHAVSGRMRMRNLRILPDAYASTVCLLSSSTR